ncbi:MAG: M28 family peptidase [Bacteroidales bacterium]|nr:M28 family peptidase [Bacteroidales bacterium]
MHYIRAAIFVFSLLLSTVISNAQSAELTKHTSAINSAKMQSRLSFISDDLTKGRASGTPGNLIVSSFLREEFSRLGMIPFYSTTFTQSFTIPESSVIGRNIIGVIPALYYTDQYILISAHYDHLGIIGGNIYNGADDNASGVTALLTIAELFSQMRELRQGPRKNIIFALFDAKESNLEGSNHFSKNLPIKSSKISHCINIDQIGCTFAPPGKRENYILYVADYKIRGDIKKRLDGIKRQYEMEIEIDHTFYNSPSFYEVFLRTSDQYNTTAAGIPSVMFTSGIHMHTYKPTDEHYFINYEVLKERIKLLFYLINNLL